MYVCVRICMYVCMRTYMYIYTYIERESYTFTVICSLFYSLPKAYKYTKCGCPTNT